MSSRSILAPAALISLSALGALGGCGDDGLAGNAGRLWLALDGRETEVRLVEFEPRPF